MTYETFSKMWDEILGEPKGFSGGMSEQTKQQLIKIGESADKPLGTIASDVAEFEKSLKSANARVLGGVSSKPLEKRTWMYAGPPISYGISPCKCGNQDCVYSEYKDRLWCNICKIDFEPEHWGIFDGPIMFQMCQLLGMNFDRIDLVNNVYVAWDGKFDADDKPIEFILRTAEEVNARLNALDKKTREFAEEYGIRAVGDKIVLV